MNTSNHHFSELFAQLGLPADDQSIQQFLTSHRPLAAGIELPDAGFWTSAQAEFLREELLEDADWAEQVDRLSAALR